MLPSRLPLILFVLLTATGVVRIVSTYRSISQTSDESSNLACGMEWLDRGRYELGPFHPPLARIAMSIGPYLYGARSQGLTDRWKEGNAVLNSARRYARTLTLARIGILVFFLLATTCVWLWSRRLLGDWGGVAAVFLFTNIPPVLAHAGVATSDMAIGAGVVTAAYAFLLWRDEPTYGRSVLLGVAIAVAFLSKFSSVVLLPACMLTILLLGGRGFRPRARAVLAAVLVAGLLIWAAYRFSFGRMTEHVAEDAAGQGGVWSRIPSSWLRALERAPVPAPQILDGFWQVHNHMDGGHAAYLLGQNSTRGWWYFFPVALGLKTPLGLLILAAAGYFALAREKLRKFDWRAWAPAMLALVVLFVCMPSTLNIGVRYALPLYPMLAIAAATGTVYLFRRRAGRVLAVILLLWTAASSMAAHPDYLAYFNEIGGRRPERFLVDSDLDWGQDMKQLAAALKQRHVAQFHLSALYSGDYALLDLPPWDDLKPYQPVTGWVAVSFTMLKTYSWLVAQQAGRSEPGFAWLDRYEPVARVGKSFLLYYIPE
ncbi:MAG: glycosyl transferase [Terriglobia bacterium]|nr:MAG: glycosyl transferase [Terriglobia bacterium]